MDKRFSPLRRRSESKLHLRVAVFAYLWRKRIIHFHAQPYTDAFLRRKAVEKSPCEDKPFAAQTPPRKRGYVEDFTLKSVNALNMTFYPSNAFSKGDHLLLRCVHVTYGKIAARQARGYGVLYEVKPFREKCYFSYTQTVNRTRFYDQIAVAR